MEVSLLAVGRLRGGPEADLYARYIERARRSGKALGMRGFAVREFPESRAARAVDRIAAEEQALLATLSKSNRFVCLHAPGALLDSEGFAAFLEKNAVAGVARLAFVIGGPDGLGEGVLGRADRRISFGRLTWPHQLCRIMLAEQLYRAMTILAGHPYHRE